MENFANSSNINIGDVSSQIRNILGQNIEEGNKNNNKNENIQYNENCTYTTSLENEYLVKQNTVKNIPYISKENIPEPNQNIQKEVTIKDTSDDIRTPYTTNCFLSKENMSKYFSNNDNEFNTNKNLQDAVNRRKQIREMILSNNSLNLSLSSHNFEQIDIKEHISEQNFTNIHKQMLDQYNSTNKGNNSRNGENGVRRDYNGKNDCTINNQNNIYGKINNNNYNSNLHNNNNNVNTGNIGIPLHKLVSNDNGNENDIDYKTFLTLDSNQTIFKAKPLKVPDISFLHSNSKSYSGNSFNNPYESERQIEYNAESNSNNDNNYNFTRNKILYEKLDGLSFYCDDDDNKIISTSRRNYQSSTLQKLTDSEDYNDNNEYLYISQNDSDKNNYEELNTKENLTTSSDKNACKCNDTHKDENKKEYNSKNYSDIDAYISNEDIKENKNDKFHKEYNHKDKYDVNKEPKHLHMHSHTRQASNKQMSNASLMKRSNSEKIFGTQKDSNIDNKTENTIHNKYINCNVNKSLDYCENINSNDKLSRIKNSNENNINCSLKRESNYNFDGILNKDHENISNSNDDALNFQANSKDNKKHLKNEMDISNSTQDDNYNYKQSIDINPNTIENIRDLIKNNKTRVENLYVNESSQDNLCINKNINELKYRMKENNKSVPLNKFNNTSNLDNEHPYSINSYNDETENRNIIQCSLDSFNDEFYNSVTIPTPAESILSKSSLCSSHNENTLKKNNFDCVDSQSANGETIDHSFPIEKENSFIKECKMEMKVHRNDLLNDNSSSNNGDNSNNIYINKKEFLGKYTYSEFSLNTKQNISNSIATNNINNVDRKFIDKNTNLIVDEVYKELFQQKKNIFPEMNNSSEIISNTSHMNNLMVNGLGNNTNWYNNDNSSYNNELGEKNKNIIRKIINTLEIKEMKTKTKQGVFEITPNGEVMFTFLGRSEIMKYKNVQNKKYVNIDISKPRKLLFIIDVGGVNIKIKDILLNIILDFYNIFEEELPQAHKVRYTYAYDVVEAFKKHTPKISLTKKWLGIYNLMSNGNAPDFIATLKSNMFIDKIEIKNNYVSFILKDKNTINLHIDDLNEVTTQFTKSMMNNKNGNIHQPNMPQSNINLIGIEGQNEHVKNIMMNLQVLLKRAGISIDIIIQNWCNTLQAYSHCLGLLTKGNSQYALKLKKTLFFLLKFS